MNLRYILTTPLPALLRVTRTMAPQQTSISNFFTKYPTSPKTAKLTTTATAESSSKSATIPAAGSSSGPGKTVTSSTTVAENANGVVEDQTTTITTPETKTTVQGSSPLNAGTKRSGGLSDAAKRAIMESALEAGSSKKLKLESPSKPGERSRSIFQSFLSS